MSGLDHIAKAESLLAGADAMLRALAHRTLGDRDVASLVAAMALTALAHTALASWQQKETP